MWNLINKTNRQAKYNQRHGNKEQTDRDQRGERRGITGERKGRVKSRKSIKDPWTRTTAGGGGKGG